MIGLSKRHMMFYEKSTQLYFSSCYLSTHIWSGFRQKGWHRQSITFCFYTFLMPSLWLRYVDDTFCILNKDHINDFHAHLNSICSHIQFTIEKERNFSLPFLDVLVKRNSRNGSIITHSLLSTTIYRKPTHTNRYLHYTSHHPKYQKLTVAKTLLSRVNTHITDNTQKHSELQNIRSTLRLNGFPTRTTFLTSRQPRSQNTQYNHFTSIPYIQGTSEKIRRVLNEAGVKVAMKPIHTIGPNFTFTERPTHP